MVRRIVRAHLRGLRRCYEVELKRDTKATGKLELMFVIDAQGRVTIAKVTDDGVGSTKMASCVVKEAKRWGFPKPSGGIVTVHYPLVFSARPA